MTKHTKPGAAPHTARQTERRRRILQATARLARRGGYDAVQMRTVAEQSEVALGTLYRYFPSKVHLLVATMQDQLAQLHTTLHRHPPAAPDPASRVTETLMRAFRQLQREPLLADAMVRALNFGDRSVCTEVDAVSRLTTALVLDAMGTTERPSPQQLSAVRVIGHTWHSALVAWLSGRSSIEQVTADIETVCALIAPRSPSPETGHAAGTAPGPSGQPR
ncbi:TetR family transcriptional regulator [Streptomyces sp. TR06-5]|uniref:TetR family transcriptional regulator n=1 Tax=unclassified Streptomyces TaxID=2593676 RepID=UPI0039A3D704